MRSNPALCGMCRDVEPNGLDEQAVGYPFERSRQTGLGAGDAQKSPDLRARERAKTLLLLSQPLLSREVAKLQDLNIETVRVTWQRWIKEGMESLNDKPRSGGPRTLDEAAVEQLAAMGWAREKPLTATECSAISNHRARPWRSTP